MKAGSEALIQTLVFLLVATGFTVVDVTQPVLPAIEGEFNVAPRTASLSVSTVILGIALANLPAARWPTNIRSSRSSSLAER